MLRVPDTCALPLKEALTCIEEFLFPNPQFLETLWQFQCESVLKFYLMEEDFNLHSYGGVSISMCKVGKAEEASHTVDTTPDALQYL